ncbi:MAG: LysR family transcriptional regulator [Deltaproteobacteria bacterium]|nr:LysR family transcriptional regulator [Deltaproteobacteria bacterium]
MGNEERIQNTAAMLVFLEVIERRSFTAAAKHLGRSKASVSKEIAALEMRLGAQLLRRTTRTMSLTEIGEAFHRRCQRVAEEAELAELSVSELQAEPRGEIRIAAPMSFGQRRLAPLLPGFLERHPEVRIDLDLTDRLIDLVREKFDLALRIGFLRDSSLVARKVGTLRLVVCASPAYLKAHGTPETPEDLVGHECHGYVPPPDGWQFDAGQKVTIRGRLNIDNGDALAQTALADAGIVYLPVFIVADELRAGRLVPILEEHTREREGGIWAVYPANRHLSPKVRAFIDYMVEAMSHSPDWNEVAPPA